MSKRLSGIIGCKDVVVSSWSRLPIRWVGNSLTCPAPFRPPPFPESCFCVYRRNYSGIPLKKVDSVFSLSLGAFLPNKAVGHGFPETWGLVLHERLCRPRMRPESINSVVWFKEKCFRPSDYYSVAVGIFLGISDIRSDDKPKQQQDFVLVEFQRTSV